MGKTRGDIKRELKSAVTESSSFDEIISKTVTYILNNFKLRDKPIDSEYILAKKKRKKHGK